MNWNWVLLTAFCGGPCDLAKVYRRTRVGSPSADEGEGNRRGEDVYW